MWTLKNGFFYKARFTVSALLYSLTNAQNSNLCETFSRVDTRGGVLEGSLDSIEHFDTSLDNYFAWMARTEKQLAEQEKKSNDEDLMEKEETVAELQQQFRVSTLTYTPCVVLF